MNKISVLIPVHNCELTLKRSIDSVLNQTYKPYEIVCILNNCTDQSKNILESYKNISNDIKFNIFEYNIKGIVPALNFGLEKCEGNLIARQDGDDFWYPEKLEKQIKFLDENKNIDIIGTQIRCVDINFNPTNEILIHPTENNDIKNNLISGRNAIAHPSVIYKKDIIYKVGNYDITYKYCEDFHLWLKSIPYFNFANISEILVDYTTKENINYSHIPPQLLTYNFQNIYKFYGIIK